MTMLEKILCDGHASNITSLFAKQLSCKFGREIGLSGGVLLATDFPPNEMLCIKFEDDSEIRFNHAFVVEGDEFYAVFTEHCGDHLVYKASVVRMWILEQNGEGSKVKYLKDEREKFEEPIDVE